MKRLILPACLLLLSIPLGSRAQDGQGGQGDDCQGQENGSGCVRKISAQQMGAIGSGVAVVMGLGGYLVLRRRKAA